MNFMSRKVTMTAMPQKTGKRQSGKLKKVK
jgi:hypothetical protein